MGFEPSACAATHVAVAEWRRRTGRFDEYLIQRHLRQTTLLKLFGQMTDLLLQSSTEFRIQVRFRRTAGGSV